MGLSVKNFFAYSSINPWNFRSLAHQTAMAIKIIANKKQTIAKKIFNPVLLDQKLC